MDKYEVIGLLGEGSFGRVYKAKQTTDSTFVALKVISKRGRSSKEIKGLRRECEIQRYLHHPNIIQMIDSFETENEIVVITEFAHKELNVILGKEGYLNEDRVQVIVWDLVSALYYLHSHRVLHRDLKPQNILLDANNCAKLCDFGFARNMSTGTHVLTSIKGTPLYMAPELIEELPYDHNADLWSLGCIIYELLVGAPPFCTASILHLIRLIRHEQIQWPTFLSENCISFLRGLLQKNPAKRLSWPEILNHPFVKGHILISNDTLSMPLTRPMSASTLQAKEQQRKEHTKAPGQLKVKNPELKTVEVPQTKTSVTSEKLSDEKLYTPGNSRNKNNSLCETLGKLAIKETGEPDFTSKVGANAKVGEVSCDHTPQMEEQMNNSIAELPNSFIGNSVLRMSDERIQLANNLSLNLNEESHPIVNEEWIVFLQRSMEEIMNGEMASLLQPNLANIIVSPLRNSNASPKVVGFVANLLCLPFVVKGVSENALSKIKQVYLDVKLIPNLMYSCKLIARYDIVSNNSTPSPSNSPTFSVPKFKILNDISDEELQAIANVMLLICHLIHLDHQFLSQVCDAIVVLKLSSLLHQLLLLCTRAAKKNDGLMTKFVAAKRKLRIVTDILAILTQILRKAPENCVIIDQILGSKHANEEELCFINLLRNSNAVLRERSCYFLLLLCRKSLEALERIWDEDLKNTLEALVYDSIESVRNAADIAVQEMSVLDFYNV